MTIDAERMAAIVAAAESPGTHVRLQNAEWNELFLKHADVPWMMDWCRVFGAKAGSTRLSRATLRQALGLPPAEAEAAPFPSTIIPRAKPAQAPVAVPRDDGSEVTPRLDA